MTIKEAQDAVDKWIKQYGVRYFSELTNMACLKWPMFFGYLYVWQIKRGSTLQKSFKRASTRKPKEMQKDIKTTLN